MPRLALARQYRPQTFDAVIGHAAVVQALSNALESAVLHHAYLFTGTRGVGKTSIARILAKCLNCEKGITSHPCGQCSTCKEIEAGKFVDLIEVDAASRTKVEDTRELLENVQYLPTRGRFKVYLIDEVHMLSLHSFNALLKTLEEPPEHVKFILATTDPQKLPATILSRCLQFHLQGLTRSEIKQHLSAVLAREKINCEAEALNIISLAADGSARDALSILEQMINLREGTSEGTNESAITQTSVRSLLGLLPPQQLLALLSALASGNAALLWEALQDLSKFSPDYAALLSQFLGLMHHVALVQQLPALTEELSYERETLLALAAKISAEELQLYYQIGLNGQRDLPYAPSPKMGFEMILLRMLAFQPAEILPDRKAGSEANSQVAASSQVAARSQGETRSQVAGRSQVAARSQVVADLPRTPHSPPPATHPKPKATPTPLPIDSRNSLENSPENSLDWASLLSKLSLRGIPKQLAEHSVVLKWMESTIEIMLAESQSPLYHKRHLETIEAAISDYFGKSFTLKMSLGPVENQTPVAKRQEKEQVAYQQAEKQLGKDPGLQELLQSFDANLESITLEKK